MLQGPRHLGRTGSTATTGKDSLAFGARGGHRHQRRFPGPECLGHRPVGDRRGGFPSAGQPADASGRPEQNRKTVSFPHVRTSRPITARLHWGTTGRPRCKKGQGSWPPGEMQPVPMHPSPRQPGARTAARGNAQRCDPPGPEGNRIFEGQNVAIESIERHLTFAPLSATMRLLKSSGEGVTANAPDDVRRISNTVRYRMLGRRLSGRLLF